MVVILQRVMRDFTQAAERLSLTGLVSFQGGLTLDTALHKYKQTTTAATSFKETNYYKDARRTWERLLKEVPDAVSMYSQEGIVFEVLSRSGFDEDHLSERVIIKSDTNHLFECEMFVDIKTGRQSICIYKESEKSSYILKLATLICSAISGRAANRPRELYELFLLTHLTNYDYNTLHNVLRERANKPRGLIFPYPELSFKECQRYYKSAKNLTSQPNFSELYYAIHVFLYPLIKNISENNRDLIWDCQKKIWVGGNTNIKTNNLNLFVV
ncbi:hypothetical protein [Paenibacillus sp. USHLN196]|uniref:hypothetical protein n=1 Tax=Paenibacillus sp. USHLN196 TaxID=3081291 RepID=UPI0030177370